MLNHKCDQCGKKIHKGRMLHPQTTTGKFLCYNCYQKNVIILGGKNVFQKKKRIINCAWCGAEIKFPYPHQRTCGGKCSREYARVYRLEYNKARQRRKTLENQKEVKEKVIR